MPTTRLAAQVENIDPESLTASPADAAALLDMTGRMTRSRLATKASRETAEDAAQVAALLACSLLADFPADQPDRLAACAALAAYRVSLAALEDQGTSKEDAADVLATDDTGAPLLRLALPVSPDPARLTRTTDRDRLADAVDRLAQEDPAAADLAALATYLPTEDGRAWRDGLPSAQPLLALLGQPNTGRNRAALGKRIRATFEALTEAMTATLHQHATRTRYGATAPVWEAHRAQVDTDGPADPTAARYGRERTLPRTGTASAVIHQHTDTGDAWIQVTPGPLATLLPLPADLDRDFVLAQVDTLPPYGRTTTDRSGDDFAAAAEPLGAVKKPSGRKRRRDGALGAPTTSGPTRLRY